MLLPYLGTGNIWELEDRVRQGEFDRYLVRPASPLLQLLTEHVPLSAFGELLERRSTEPASACDSRIRPSLPSSPTGVWPVHPTLKRRATLTKHPEGRSQGASAYFVDVARPFKGG